MLKKKTLFKNLKNLGLTLGVAGSGTLLYKYLKSIKSKKGGIANNKIKETDYKQFQKDIVENTVEKKTLSGSSLTEPKEEVHTPNTFEKEALSKSSLINKPTKTKKARRLNLNEKIEIPEFLSKKSTENKTENLQEKEPSTTTYLQSNYTVTEEMMGFAIRLIFLFAYEKASGKKINLKEKSIISVSIEEENNALFDMNLLKKDELMKIYEKSDDYIDFFNKQNNDIYNLYQKFLEKIVKTNGLKAWLFFSKEIAFAKNNFDKMKNAFTSKKEFREFLLKIKKRKFSFNFNNLKAVLIAILTKIVITLVRNTSNAIKAINYNSDNLSTVIHNPFKQPVVFNNLTSQGFISETSFNQSTDIPHWLNTTLYQTEINKNIKSFEITEDEDKLLTSVGISERDPEKIINPYFYLLVEAQNSLKEITKDQANAAENFFEQTLYNMEVDEKLYIKNLLELKKTSSLNKKIPFLSEIIEKTFPGAEKTVKNVFLHEISHTLMAHKLKHKVFTISSNMGYKGGGYMTHQHVYNIISDIKISLSGTIGTSIFSGISDIDFKKLYMLYPMGSRNDFKSASKFAIEYIMQKNNQGNNILNAEDIAQESLDLLNKLCKETYDELFEIIVHSQKEIGLLFSELEKEFHRNKWKSGIISDLFGTSIEIEEDFIDKTLNKKMIFLCDCQNLKKKN